MNKILKPHTIFHNGPKQKLSFQTEQISGIDQNCTTLRKGDNFS